MANDNICVVCGDKVGTLRYTTVCIAATWQVCCRDCAKELKELGEDDQCRRALRLGYAQLPERLEARIKLISEAEEHRPSCLRCGAKLKFAPVQCLDNSPVRDSIFSDVFELQPAYCKSCGKYEFYHPGITSKDPFIAYLIEKDTAT